MLSPRAIAMIAAIGIDCVVNYKIRNKNVEYKQANATLYSCVLVQQMKIDYLVDILKRNEIELDEFDQIAIKEIADKFNEI